VRLLVTGGEGQLGRSLVSRARATAIEVIAAPHRELDITSPASVKRAIAATSPTCIINAAAYNAVDAAEREREKAFAVNRDGAEVVARAGAECGIPVIHLSTDYVFDGFSTAPLEEGAAAAPINTYGESKLVGEQRVLAAGGMVVRTSWLFAAGGPGFVQTILGLALTRPVIEVVRDQRGCPTWAEDLAEALLILAEAPTNDLLHYCGTPPVTRAELAEEIVKVAARYRPITCRIAPVPTPATPGRGARRPSTVELDTQRAARRGVPSRRWQPGLAEVLASELAS
jgi:dTDP-4-dehydrorhamnose reductase